jgi:glycosyltransferase involved in cell wall biosynthesis
VRDELELDQTNFVLGTAATLKPWKRIDRLVDLVAEMREPTLRVLVLGEGPEQERLRARAEQRQIARNVIFVGSTPNVADYLQVMDAFCLPSMGLESFGNAAVEAMGVGLPTIIFSDGGGMAEHIEDGRTGFVVPDNATLARTVARLMESLALRRRIGASAMEAVRARYTLARAVASYRALYEHAIASRLQPDGSGRP